jgi:hypothetical protein
MINQFGKMAGGLGVPKNKVVESTSLFHSGEPVGVYYGPFYTRSNKLAVIIGHCDLQPYGKLDSFRYTPVMLRELLQAREPVLA